MVTARTPADPDTTYRVAWCDASGAFLLGVPDADRLSLSRQVELNANHALHGSVSKIVDNAANEGVIDLSLVPCSDVAIDVVDQSGNGLPGLEVEVIVVGTHLLTATRGASLCMTRTGAGGELHFLGLAAGEVELRLKWARDVQVVPQRFDPAVGGPQRVTVIAVPVQVTTQPNAGDVRLRWLRVGPDGVAHPVRNQTFEESKRAEWLLSPRSLWRVDANSATHAGSLTFEVPDTQTACRFVIPLLPK